MTTPRGYAGSMLSVDLSTGQSTTLDTFWFAEDYVGGRGIATRLYWDHVDPGIDAFDERNVLIFSLGPLAGVPELGGSRWGVFAKSPLTTPNHFCYGNLGGHFGAELKFAGFDGLIVRGKADRPVILSINEGKVQMEPADHVWGMSATESIESIKENYGGRAKVVTIGPAGERLIKFATLFADGDASCSGGMGAVMGSKNLKAVVVGGNRRKPDFADPDELHRLASYIRGIGRGNVKVWGFDFMAHGPNIKKMPCFGCMANCLRVSYTAKNGESGKYMCQSRFFYFPYSVLYYGEENDVPFFANRACDKYGVDTWAVQELVEWLMRCYEEGIVTEEQTGLPLKTIGSLEFIEKLIETVSLRKGFGELLSKGVHQAARELGEEAVSHITHPDPYEPRLYNIQTFLFPFEPRQPIQQLHEAGLLLSQWSSWLQGVEGSHISTDVLKGIARTFWGTEKAADLTTLDGKAEAAFNIQNRQYAKESLVVCDWMYPVIDKPYEEDHIGDPTIESRILQAATGVPRSEQDLYTVGERIFNLQRAVLLREGHRAGDDDILPSIWHEQPLEEHIADPECLVPGATGDPVSRLGEKIDMPSFLKARKEYYTMRKWDAESGLPTYSLLTDLHMEDVAAELLQKGLCIDDKD